MVLTLAPWGERHRTQAEIVADINQGRLARVPALRGNAIQSNSLRIRGAGNGLQMALIGNDHEALTAGGAKLVQALDATGQFDTPRLNNEPTQAQVSVRSTANAPPISASTSPAFRRRMQSLLEGRSVVDVFVNGEAYPVLLTSTTGRSTIRPILKMSS
jgi:HAE1 family hydrophobic/amphiphilic exporter-1